MAREPTNHNTPSHPRYERLRHHSTPACRMPLQRTKSYGKYGSDARSGMRTSSRAASVSARQSAARSASTGLKRVASVREGQVIATAVKQAERNVFLHKEEKYFKAVGGDDLAISPQVTSTGTQTTSTLAFSTTSRINPADPTGPVMAYCGHNMLDLQMLNPFLNSELNAQLHPNVMEGKRAVPTTSKVNWTVNRNYVRNGVTRILGNNHGQPPVAAVNDTQLYQNLPIRCRMIRVTPKLSPGVTTANDPTNDLFLDQLGLSYSPASVQWSQSDNEFARVNTRKYTVLGDTKFTLGQPITASWATNWAAGLSGTLEDSRPEVCAWRQDLTIPDKPVLKRLTTNHQLATKKSGEVYFDTGSAGTATNATSGMRREYVFLHFWYESGDGGTSTPTLITAGKVPDAEAVKVHYRVESRFREP
ncbi:hypothetical protein ES703_116369 [subsurface metagenome]